MEAKTRPMTVVFAITDEEAAKPFLSLVGGAFAQGTPIPGVEVTAMSCSDEMTKLEELYDLCEGEGLYVPEELRP